LEKVWGWRRFKGGARRHVAAHAVLAAGDQVVAVVQLVVGVPEDGRVARQRLALVEAHACAPPRRRVIYPPVSTSYKPIAHTPGPLHHTSKCYRRVSRHWGHGECDSRIST